jgi:hypothetical protein
MNTKGFLTIAFMILAISTIAQNIESDISHHEHHRNEIGIANSPVYFIKERELS